jgi:hypothetical protein
MDQLLCRAEEHPGLDPGFECHVVQVPGGGVVICVNGHIDCLTAPTLDACLDQQLALTSQAARVEVALTYTAFLGARGITTLLTAGHTARLRAVDFQITGARRGCFACSSWSVSVRSFP